ncbi:hypothetical protein DRN72_00540 [Methanosarcinales archaeon]|nr:MAG: hypothetical protein DRN72_00540 [Methanosarcinales archaeon]
MPTLILCVDRDNDLGVKAGIKTPVIGRENCLNAAMKLGSVDPEDSDLNSIFGGIQLYDEMVKEDREVEIAIVAGDSQVGVRSDEMIASQLEELRKRYGGWDVVLVSDGAEDEQIVPIVNSRFKINSVRRVVVKQSQNLESAYYLLKEFFENRKTRNSILIPFGLALLSYSIALVFGKTEYAISLIAGVVGAYVLLRGLGVDTFVGDLREGVVRALRGRSPSMVFYLLSISLFVIGSVEGLLKLWVYYTNAEIFYGYFSLFLIFVFSSLWWYVGATMFFTFGDLLEQYLKGESIESGISHPFFVLAAGVLVWGATSYLLSSIEAGAEGGFSGSFISFVITVVLSIVITFAGVFTSSRIMRTRA